jgi:hypothetical protein
MTPSSDHLVEDKVSSSVSTDRSLLQRLRRGSQDAALQLYLRYAQRLRALEEGAVQRDSAPGQGLYSECANGLYAEYCVLLIA